MELSDSVSKLPLVGARYATKLEKLGVFTIEDLLYHAPSRYKDYTIISDISNIQPGETVTVQGYVESIKNIYTKYGKGIQLALIRDNSGEAQVVWFNQTYLVRSIKSGEKYSFSGKVDEFNRKISLVSPDYENIQEGGRTLHTARLVPVYPETHGVSSKWLRGKINFTFQTFKDRIYEFLPKDVLGRLDLPEIKSSFEQIHFPEKLELVEKARQRLAFNELLFLQLRSLYRKKDWSKNKVSHALSLDKKLTDEFISSLPFKLTSSQVRSINEVSGDLKEKEPMNRLLEGDVGSGKTVVAAFAAFVSFINGYQTVVMAPTQILATQHYKTFSEIFSNLKIRISLITSAGTKSELGKTDIFIGTHALIHKKVKFDRVALVVIDEQHRFGVEQRAHLVKKSAKGKHAPNILTMTATPIPRTVALTVYGDLDLSTLDELPSGRKPITTWIVPPQKRNGAYGWIKDKVNDEKIQVFFICPLIEESQVETMKSIRAATQEFEELKKEFKGLKLGLLHGRQKAKEKDGTLDAFRSGKIDILVSTPVVEVGIDVPNATIMVIEAGERYGLSQLHQLRGRIGRGDKKSYCLVFTDNRSAKVNLRLNALTKSLSGFELAELDLKMRGPGELFGTRQHGFPELKIASWGDSELIKLSRELAEEVIKNPKKFSKLIEKVTPEEIIRN